MNQKVYSQKKNTVYLLPIKDFVFYLFCANAILHEFMINNYNYKIKTLLDLTKIK